MENGQMKSSSLKEQERSRIRKFHRQTCYVLTIYTCVYINFEKFKVEN